MKRRDFLIGGLLSGGAVFTSISGENQKEETASTSSASDPVRNNLGIMKWSDGFFRYIFGIHFPDKETVEQALLRLCFPKDTQVIKVFQEPKDIPFGIIRILVSQKDLPRVCEGCEIPIVDVLLERPADVPRFANWL